MSVQSSLVMYPIYAYGTEAQRTRYLPALARGDKVGAFGLTEPLNGSDASGLLTTATKVEGGYKINGQKRWIGNATFSDVIVWARNTSDGNKV